MLFTASRWFGDKKVSTRNFYLKEIKIGVSGLCLTFCFRFFTRVACFRKMKSKTKNRSAMCTWGLILKFIPFGWNAVLKYQYLGVKLLQVKR